MSKLTLQQANTIVSKGFEKAREMKVKPLGIVVLDDAEWTTTQEARSRSHHRARARVGAR